MDHKRVRVNVDISWNAILKVLLVAFALWAASSLRDIIFMIFIVFIFVAGVSPLIRYMQTFMSRTLAVILFYVALFLLVCLFFYTFVPLLVHQIDSLVTALPNLVGRVNDYLHTNSGDQYTHYLQNGIDSISNYLKSFTGDIFQTTASVFGSLATVVTGIILSFYLLLEEKNARDFFYQILPHHKFEAVYTTVHKISLKMGDWIRGQLLLMLIIGLCNFIIYLIIGVPAPFALGIWSGVCEIIPYFGPFLGVVPALFIAFASGNYIQVVLVLILNFIFIQQVEANLIVPKIMGRAVGLSPVLVILALAVGLKLFGLPGAIVSLPAAAVLSVIFGEWSNLRPLWERSEEEEAGAA